MPKTCLQCGEKYPDTSTFCSNDGSPLRGDTPIGDLVGQLVADRYRITELLSFGGMGAVYKASDVRLPQLFAVKVLRQERILDASIIARFRQEAEAVCRINHDRVARVYDFGFLPDQRAYIVMEFVDGRTLKQMIDSRGKLDPPEVAKITSMIAEGIDAAHRLGIVHRDLKPENIMILDDPGGGVRLKVLDFGIAKLQNAEGDRVATEPGFVIGTPTWMSPEQLTGGDIDARSDIYSLALLSFTMLTGEKAFAGNTSEAEMMARISQPPRTLDQVAPRRNWPTALQAVLDRALSREPGARYDSALEFAKALTDATGPAQERASRRIVVRPDGTSGETEAAPAESRKSSSGRDSVRESARSTPSSTVPVVATSRTSTTAVVVGSVALVVIAAVSVVWYRRTNDTIDNGAKHETTTSVTKPEAGAIASEPPASSMPAGDQPTPGTRPGRATTAPGVPSTSGKVADGAGQMGKGTTTPPQSDASTAGGTPPAKTGGDKTKRNEELQKIMSSFDDDGSVSNARRVVSQLDALQPKLTTGIDQAWAQIYLGLSHWTLGDKTKACSAFIRAQAIDGASDVAKKDSEEKRLALGCPPP
jgi:serine/threonine-protein kinase